MLKLVSKTAILDFQIWLRTRGLGVRVPQGVFSKASKIAEIPTETAFFGAFLMQKNPAYPFRML
jgi:hypothetical protein